MTPRKNQSSHPNRPRWLAITSAVLAAIALNWSVGARACRRAPNSSAATGWCPSNPRRIPPQECTARTRATRGPKASRQRRHSRPGPRSRRHRRIGRRPTSVSRDPTSAPVRALLIGRRRDTSTIRAPPGAPSPSTLRTTCWSWWTRMGAASSSTPVWTIRLPSGSDGAAAGHSGAGHPRRDAVRGLSRSDHPRDESLEQRHPGLDAGLLPGSAGERNADPGDAHAPSGVGPCGRRGPTRKCS